MKKLVALASVLALSGSLGVPALFAGSGGSYFPGARVHAALLRDSILNPEHGAVEAWYRQTSDPVPYRHNPHRLTSWRCARWPTAPRAIRSRR